MLQLMIFPVCSLLLKLSRSAIFFLSAVVTSWLPTLCEQIRAMGSITTDFSSAFNKGPWSTRQQSSEQEEKIRGWRASPSISHGRIRRYWALGDRSKSTHDKIGIVAARMVKIHLWLPSEQAIKAVMQAAVAAGFVRQEDERIGIVRSIKGALKQRTKAKSKSLQLPTPMPSHPNQLPAEIFEAAYPAE